MNKINYLYRAFRYRYILDSNEIEFIVNNLKKGDVAVDIGCHKGGYLYWIRNKVGKTGKVYAFEPQTKLFAYLQEVSKAYNFQNVVIENKGISSKPGTLNLHIPVTKSGSSPGARIDLLNNSDEFIIDKIEVVTLDNYFLNKGILPALLKIDVEGHEKQVLLGGIELLKKCMPKILMECENRHLATGNIFDVFDVLLNLGYKGYFVENKKRKPISEFNLETHQKETEGRFWVKEGYINNFMFEV